MKLKQTYQLFTSNSIRLLLLLFLLLTGKQLQAQITIGGNVYGGGNEGDVGGNTTVTVRAGDLNKVYGGARMADVGGRAFVNVDGEHASAYMLINYVYGGNDISGTISATNTTVPGELTYETENHIDNTWNAFVRVSTKTTNSGAEADDAKKIYIGQLFGGGNGDYDYTTQSNENPYYGLTAPNLGKTYLELLGGSIVNAFGGGNMATVTDDVVIHLNNPSEVVNHIKVKDGVEDNVNGSDLLTESRFIQMGINYKFTYPNSAAFQIGNLFGGNNKVDMAIQPKWNLLGGKVRNLYSGGNEGRMTCPQGLLLVIPENSTLTVDNLYGGCRKSDVRPLDAYGNDVPNEEIQLAVNPTGIPAGYAARTRILGGHINNVYGGNDISGNVYGGNTVAILTTIYGNVYGGGNGSYAYTDNPKLKDDLLWHDFYYNPEEVLTAEEKEAVTDSKLLSATALNKVRPNAEQVSLLLRGTAGKPVFVEGSVFVGGNSASLQELTDISNRQAHVKIGSYVTIDNLFLGNNGENMVKHNEEVRNADGLETPEGVLWTIAKYIDEYGNLYTPTTDDTPATDRKFNSMVLTDPDVFDKYMEGCAMKLLPSVVFDDVVDYEEYSSQFGSLYCGGNVGSMLTNGLTEISFTDKVIIYDKIVGGCNRANVAAEPGFNAAYYGGLIGTPDSNGDKLKINFSGLKIQPMRWKDPNDKLKGLVWHTVKYNATTQKFDEVPNVTPTEGGQNIQIDANDDNATVAADAAAYIARRLKGGNIYGGCYESGHVNGNVILNINETLMERDKLFDLTDEGDILYENTEKGKYTITKRNTGVILSEQGMDVLGDALNVFGAGYGADSEIWGSTTINLNKGYVFQIFGGGEMGAIGKKDKDGKYGIKGSDGTYGPDEKYSTYINLNGPVSLPGVARGATGDSPDMAECEFIYGGAFEGVIAGSTHINLGNGRIFNSFAGSCNANILGHTETYVGSKKKTDGTYEDGNGFPWIRDHIYGGNDLGGKILGKYDFSSRIRSEVVDLVAPAYKEQVANAATYMEYTQGRVRNILGGCFGDYDYAADAYKNRVTQKPFLHNTFVNFRPNTNVNNAVDKIFGAGEGCPGDRDGDKGQDHSYVLIDIPDNVDKFTNTEVFGAGAYNGLGMGYTAAETFETDFDLNEASAIIDLMRGEIGAAYGGSYEEGITRRTVVNVPVKANSDKKSTIKINNIFGGAYGLNILPPCDVYEANVNYQSGDARVNGAIYGGNNNVRRTLYGKVNISAPVLKDNGDLANVYGAGRGQYTWSEYTEVNLKSGANVWEVYGGGELGNVLNAESVQKYLQTYKDKPAEMVAKEDEYWGDHDKWVGGNVGGTLNEEYRTEWLEAWMAAWTIDGYYNPVGDFTRYVGNSNVNLLNPLVREAKMDDRDLSRFSQDQKDRTLKRYNANVIIEAGATVSNYAYGGGYGSATIPLTGGVYGSTYVALLGGTVGKDIYAAGTTGSVCDIFGAGVPGSITAPGSNSMGFIASANAYIEGGTVRNVFGGGWRGSVGYHSGTIGNVSKNTSDIDGEVHVVVGDLAGTNHTGGIPSITRNVYGGGEGGAIYGDAYVKMNKGYIGYRYNSAVTDDDKTKDFDERYVPELDDVAAGDNLLDLGGNVFGGGYVANSYVDRSHVTMMGGIVRGSLYGGGEIGPIGRGTIHTDSIDKYRDLYPDYIKNGAAIYKGGETHVYLWDGHVMRDVFGGGRGYDNWGGEGYMTDEEKKTMDRSSKGYVFGSTDVHIYGGEVGTETNVLKGYGNVFGGGNEGFVYSAIGTKSSTDGYYYKNGNASEGLSEDCKIAVEPRCKVTDANGIQIGGTGGTTYAQGEYVPVEELNKLQSRSFVPTEWAKLDTRGIVIHNALFAGGNITEGSDKIFANTITVYGNAAASLRDVYNFDLISLGTEEMGGIYGDGNLTLVDGFRELHIDNYGTDYYSLAKTMMLKDYEKLTTRQQAYYKLKYGAKETHTYEYYESKQLHTYKYTDSEGSHEISYRKGQKITHATFNGFENNPSDPSNPESPKEKSFWQQGTKSYQKDEQIEEGEYSLMDGEEIDGEENETIKTGEKANWDLLGVTSIYAGRPMNTIQRADFCGVFGSRMVMKGAVDRAPQVNGSVDYNSYTINRVDEVSLNKRLSQAGDTSNEDKEHGNYFGIYNSVKYLGNLTSDVKFADVRKTDTDNTSIEADNETSYYDWKLARSQNKYRNNGISKNMVALASGVYLELKKEETESAGEDKWGYITGVIELDLINVMPGMGGGYVYAKNEHGTPSVVSSVNKVSLLDYNASASTYRQFSYTDPANKTSLQAIETSGNFVHNTKQIVDDCYPNGGIYNDLYDASPAHYWYIRGSIYVYEQYISAFTGSANATAEKQEIPLTITAASNGRMTLRDVQPNYYAYFDKGNNKLGSEGADSVFVVNNVAYKLNQAISNWEYSLLSEGDKTKFVDKTYVVVEDCEIGTTAYKKGTVMLDTEYDALKNSNPNIEYMDGDEKKENGNFDYFFRLSNNLSHNTGYVLTYDVNNPMVWNNYYTKTASPGQANALNTQQYVIDGKDKDGNQITKSDYIEGPTYSLKSNVTNSVFGQQDYTLGSIIYGKTKTTYDNTVYNRLSDKTGQAQVEQAYVVTKDYSVKENGEEVQKLTVGTPIYKSKYTDAQWNAIISANAAEEAKVCTSLLEFSSSDYVWAGKVLSSSDIDELADKIIEKNQYEDDPSDATNTAKKQAERFLSSYLDDAYYCTQAGKYGGIFFEKGKAYRALDTWCSMPAEERVNFDFNYDALDLLIDPNFSDAYGNKVKYDGPNTNKVYSSPQAIDYQAEFVGYKDANSQDVTEITYTPRTGSSVTISKSTSQKDWLSREQYEAIPNEKRHYSPIIVTAPGDYYMVSKTFMDGEVPYTTGQQITKETYDGLGSIKQANIDKFVFVLPTGDADKDKDKAITNPQKKDSQNRPMVDSEGHPVHDPITYYYCRQSYTINEKGMGQSVTTIAIEKNGNDESSTTYNEAKPEVEGGVVINETTYDGLCNFQKGFVVHGTSPTEVSTLYVSNESDINDLSAEKIITVVYLYEYDESDESGLNVTPVSERHILNIHINFKSGVPEIGEINKPDLVLPGTTLGMNIPSITQGAFRVTESGWEIFSNDDDAATHHNGMPFYNNETPLYWYQNNYWIAYYAQTSLGRTYSNSVKLNVANYHDLKKVMDDKEHHYYIDHKDVDRQPKIYINDYSASGENGLDLFKNLIDLSYITKTYNTNGDPVPVSSGTLKGHVPFDNHKAKPMKGGQYLEFFLKSDLSHPDTEAADEWTPIADGASECFSGKFHGDGHTISGLDKSLFNHLCGDVYNLGVTGSFTGAGIAETGGGYVENCWISTSPTVAKTSMPVFGNPTGLSEDRPYRIVNCYYQEEDDATTKYANHPESTYGKPTRKDSKAFYNGEVAYDLNGFYLYKRYSDQKENSGTSYQCYHMNEEGTALELQTKHYGAYTTTTAPLCSFGYVENRYDDGDFRFAEGKIPSSEDKRAYSVKDTNDNEVTRYAPIWPDDYLFFGQSLTFDYGSAHQSQPSAVKKSAGRLVAGTGSNRVYRAPAYYDSKDMGIAHFNPDAILAATSNPEAGTPVKEAYPGMTAIDFAGHKDKEYKLGLKDGFFYSPLLDDDGLSSIKNAGETHNLLVYAPSADANLATYGVLNRYFTEPVYNTYAPADDPYGRIAVAPTSTIYGHVIQATLTNGKPTATNDHLLVDKHDFNCPIAYTMGGNRMWYQRTPDNFVTIESGVTKGWEDISLPFKVNLVSTQDKGEITHFYTGSTAGHEYWLRYYDGNLQQKEGNVYTADFNLLDPVEDSSKPYTNRFLWDYYYSKNPNGNVYGDDKNRDDYKQYYYYGSDHTFAKYPFEQAGVAYLIGFPGKSYYEFDLSGQWTAANTASPAPGPLYKQIITFASNTGVGINVSDDEISNGKTLKDGFAYVPNYTNKIFADAGESYLMDDDGDSYVKNVENATVSAFRPYIVAASVGARAATRTDTKNVEQIEFDIKDTQFKPEDKIDRYDGTLEIYGKKGKIVVQSSLRYTVDLSVYTPAGVKVATFSVPAGETVEQRINTKGVYIVHSDDGQHVKKVIVN